MPAVVLTDGAPLTFDEVKEAVVRRLEERNEQAGFEALDLVGGEKVAVDELVQDGYLEACVLPQAFDVTPSPASAARGSTLVERVDLGPPLGNERLGLGLVEEIVRGAPRRGDLFAISKVRKPLVA